MATGSKGSYANSSTKLILITDIRPLPLCKQETTRAWRRRSRAKAMLKLESMDLVELEDHLLAIRAALTECDRGKGR